ncbi:protogloblin ApPgb [Streptomyces cadmiisoli]|uniref:Protogloblin ApPgb n=1 Tax=Streptomyces cadmiisoli TaxID=2184053 RepID=A0A2Z4ISH3_9ACTN|nr:protogloblin ApPgb [Streptomyces cadmiisoli]
MSTSVPPGYQYGDSALPLSPVTVDDLEKLKASVLFTEADEAALRQAWSVLKDQVESILDVWYGFVGSHEHLVAYFSTPEGQPIGAYLDAVRPRFGKWIEDTCTRPYDTTWLTYQDEIALRHTPAKKNQTDHVESVPNVAMRYLVAFIYPITATVRPFLTAGGHSEDEVEAMHQAWFKAVTLQVALWTRPYVSHGW